MNDTNLKRKWSFPLLITALSLLLYPSQAASQKNIELPELKENKVSRSLSASENVSNGVAIQKAQVYYNKKGLKDEILIECPLRELNAISKTKGETVEKLIEHISVWIPQMYSDIFLVNPRCIIILETKINEEGKAEVRFGVAMKCTLRSHVPEIIHI